VIVVADTSVILNLALVGHENLLDAIFHEVVVPPAVQSEFVRLAESSGRFALLANKYPSRSDKVCGQNWSPKGGNTRD
jgi:predicted nucleic acid-binding protein